MSAADCVQCNYAPLFCALPNRLQTLVSKYAPARLPALQTPAAAEDLELHCRAAVDALWRHGASAPAPGAWGTFLDLVRKECYTLVSYVLCTA